MHEKLVDGAGVAGALGGGNAEAIRREKIEKLKVRARAEALARRGVPVDRCSRGLKSN